MFKKSKPKVEPPPTAPTLDEMLTDIETFDISQCGGNTINRADVDDALLTEPENLNLDTWWQVFDEYDQKVKKLVTMMERLDSHKENLLACKIKLEENAETLRKAIHEQQAIIKEAVDC